MEKRVTDLNHGGWVGLNMYNKMYKKVKVAGMNV